MSAFRAGVAGWICTGPWGGYASGVLLSTESADLFCFLPPEITSQRLTLVIGKLLEISEITCF